MRDLRHQEEEEEDQKDDEEMDDEEMEEVGKHAKVSIVVKSPSVTPRPRPGRKVIAGSSINHSGSSNRFLFLCC